MSQKILSLILLFASNFGLISSQSKPPNIIFFYADDLDLQLNTPDLTLTKSKAWIQDEGATFENAFVTVPICCPNRASTLTGLYQNNHGVFNNSWDGNCPGQAWVNGPEKQTYGSIIKDQANYTTAYIGKYLNDYGIDETPGNVTHIPPGWDEWFVQGKTSRYYDYFVSNNGIYESHGSDYETDYFTDLMKNRSLDFLNDYIQSSKDKPFLLVSAVTAPHFPWDPAPQYANAFADEIAPRDPRFNYVEDPSFEKHWFVSAQPRPLNQTTIDEIDEIHRNRLRTMLSVDDLIDEVMTLVEDAGLLDNTYVIFSSDHGYHIGQHTMHFGKALPYEYDLRVPLWIRGPGIFPGTVIPDIAVNIDLAPTFIDMAKLEVPAEMDGMSLLPVLQGMFLPVERDSFLVSYNGQTALNLEAEEDCAGITDEYMLRCSAQYQCRCKDCLNNTYSCVRHLSSASDTLFCEFDDDVSFEEYYNIANDPYQLFNLAIAKDDEPDKEVKQDIMKNKQRLNTLRFCSGYKNCNINSKETKTTAMTNGAQSDNSFPFTCIFALFTLVIHRARHYF